MLELAFYDAIWELGRAEGFKAAIFAMARRRLGEPDKVTRDALRYVIDSPHLERISYRLNEDESGRVAGVESKIASA
jgi:hypothetical protein